MNKKVIAGLIALAPIIFGLHAAGWLPVTQSALASSQASQDKLFALSEIRTLIAELAIVQAALRSEPGNVDKLRRQAEIEMELKLLRDKLATLK